MGIVLTINVYVEEDFQLTLLEPGAILLLVNTICANRYSAICILLLLISGNTSSVLGHCSPPEQYVGPTHGQIWSGSTAPRREFMTLLSPLPRLHSSILCSMPVHHMDRFGQAALPHAVSLV